MRWRMGISPDSRTNSCVRKLDGAHSASTAAQPAISAGYAIRAHRPARSFACEKKSNMAKADSPIMYISPVALYRKYEASHDASSAGIEKTYMAYSIAYHAA